MANETNPGVSRRTVLFAAVAAAPMLALGSAQAGTLPQAAVAYQKEPKDGKQCDGCNLFIAPGSCKSVAGEIVPTGYCKRWVKKPA